MTTRPLHDQCFICKHIHEATMDNEEGNGPKCCDAFPEGIPDALLWEGEMHDKPYPGDHGIQFEPYEPGKTVEDVDRSLARRLRLSWETVR